VEYQKNFKKFKEFIGLFDKVINTNDFQLLKKIIPSIDNFEEFFLSGYHKRKKEGTFYTSRIISDFIVRETLLCLINKKLNLYNQDFKKIQEIDDIYNFTPDFKQKIIDLLLNIKICDPACGSGGFLLSSAGIILNIIKKININFNELNVKDQIIGNLFGYDINEYALKLCILKLLRWYCEGLDISIERPSSILKSNIELKNSIINSKVSKFDIIIGNPPYGNILNQNEKQILKKENIFYKDIYCTFLLKALDWSSELIGLLVPKSFLLRQGYLKFRNEFLSRANIVKIFDIGSKMFKNATNEVQMVLYENKNEHRSRDLTIYDYPNIKIIKYQNQKVDSLRICFNLNCPLCLNSKKLYVYTFKRNCPICGSATIDLNRIRIKPNKNIYFLLEKIEKIGDLNFLNPINFPKMIRGEEEKGLRLVRKKLRKDTNGSCFFISARNDFTYYIFNKSRSFNIEEINAKILKGNDYEYYKKPKLLIKHNNIIPEALFTEDRVCFSSSIYSLLHDNTDELKYLCAVLNSSLIQFYCTYAINNQKDTTINLNQYMIRHLPIIKPNFKNKIKIAEKVDIINYLLNLNNGIVEKNVYKLLREIDDAIFDLYSITDIERDLIISRTKDQIKHFKSIYGN